MTEFMTKRFSPFKSRNFSLFFAAHTLSLVGKWSHELARAWLIFEITGQAGAMGFVLLAGAVPVALFMLYGGALVDRSDAKKMMIGTQTVLALASLFFAFHVEFRQVFFWHLVAFAVLEGLIMAFDVPSFQALVVKLVPKEDYQQALALNSTIFHLGRVIGPVLAGLLMAFHGPSLVFLFDGITFLVLLIILYMMRWDEQSASEWVPKKPKPIKSNFEDIKEGLVYLFTTHHLRYPLSQLFITIIVIFPMLISVLRTYIPINYNLSASEYGWVFAFPAVGSMMGALFFMIWKPEQPLKALKFGVPFTALGIFLIPMCTSIMMACLLMSVAGFFTYLSLASLTVSLHLSILEQYRGRLSSVVGLGFLCIGPLLSYPIGKLSDYIGYEVTIQISAITFFIFSVALYFLTYKSSEVVKVD